MKKCQYPGLNVDKRKLHLIVNLKHIDIRQGQISVTGDLIVLFDYKNERTIDFQKFFIWAFRPTWIVPILAVISGLARNVYSPRKKSPSSLQSLIWSSSAALPESNFLLNANYLWCTNLPFKIHFLTAKDIIYRLHNVCMFYRPVLYLCMRLCVLHLICRSELSTQMCWAGTCFHRSASFTIASASIRPKPYRWLTVGHSDKSQPITTLLQFLIPMIVDQNNTYLLLLLMVQSLMTNHIIDLDLSKRGMEPPFIYWMFNCLLIFKDSYAG